MTSSGLGGMVPDMMIRAMREVAGAGVGWGLVLVAVAAFAVMALAVWL